MGNATFLGPLCAFGASVTWAVGSVGYSRLARQHSPFAVNLGRAMVAFPLFALAITLQAGSPGQAIHHLAQASGTQVMWLAASALASYGLGDALFMWSTQSLGVPAALAIGSTYPLLTAGVGALVQGESLALRQIFGLLLTVAGVVIVILRGAQATHPSSAGMPVAPGHLAKKRVGVALAFGTALMWALNSLAVARSSNGLDAFTANTFRMFFALGMTTGFSRVLAPGTRIALPWQTLKKAIPLYVFEGFGGSLCFVYGLGHSSLAVGSTLSSLAPVLSVPVALALKLEKFSPIRTLGVCLVVVGLWFLVGAI